VEFIDGSIKFYHVVGGSLTPGSRRVEKTS
jgi:hypothetical protein